MYVVEITIQPPAADPKTALYLQVLAALHQILDIIDGRKEQVEDLEELMFLLREPCICQEFYQVAKVVAAAANRIADIKCCRCHSLRNGMKTPP